MKELNIDFHIHSRYSGGVSKDMTLPIIAEQAPFKGLDIVATGDCIHESWLRHLKDFLTEEDGLFTVSGSNTRFILQTEVEDARRVHHVILLPSLSSAQQLRESLKPYSVNIDADGRPNIRLDGAELVDHVLDVDGIIGPSHAFTPWTAVYKEYDSLADCYKDNLKHIYFLELGLSADTHHADRIEELKDLTFMTNSDCHSPWPHRLGREFNRIKVKESSFTEVVKAIKREGGRGFVLNAGLNPFQGKYHVTACSRCYLKYRTEDALDLKRRCPECRGIIKKGVEARIDELATWDKPRHPDHRPPYVHILPLAQVISLATGVKTITAKKIMVVWEEYVNKFGSEINVLLDADLAELRSINQRVGEIIGMMRSGSLKYVAGGGGNYGKPTLTGEKDKYWSGGQKTLGEY